MFASEVECYRKSAYRDERYKNKSFEGVGMAFSYMFLVFCNKQITLERNEVVCHRNRLILETHHRSKG